MLAPGSAYTEQGLKLMGSGEVGSGAFGHTVAISADGNTALVGGNEDDNFTGAAWIFSRGITGWAQQSGKLAGPDSFGHFGESIALSGDGNTALIGARASGTRQAGAAFVYTRSGATWTQGAKLTSGIDFDEFGASVALSADGTTALIGSANAARVFTRSGSTWTQQGLPLTGIGATGNADFGGAAALSSDGNTAVVGGNADSASKGAAWVFTRSGGAWHTGPMLTGGASEAGAARFGSSVALSGDGSTALIGGPEDNAIKGAAWVFVRSGGSWTQQGPKLVGVGETGNGNFAGSVALSNDGNVALVGAPSDDAAKGGVWVFSRSGGAWHKGQTLTGSENATTLFGSGVSLSSDGSTAFIGGEAGQGPGEAWVFAVVAIGSLNPTSGPAGGGTAVKLAGSGFTGATSVTFGGKPATLFKVESDTSITAVAPPGQAGAVDVVVTVPGSTTPVGSDDRFTYTAPGTTGTSSTSTTTATTTTTTASAKGPVARVVYAVVRGSGRSRTLSVRIRVSEPATARLVLLEHGKQELSRAFHVNAGGNTLPASLAAKLSKGIGRLTIVLTDRNHRRRQLSVTVSVPA